jgi:hypothetical protein
MPAPTWIVASRTAEGRSPASSVNALFGVSAKCPVVVPHFCYRRNLPKLFCGRQLGIITRVFADSSTIPLFANNLADIVRKLFRRANPLDRENHSSARSGGPGIREKVISFDKLVEEEVA